MNSIGRASRTRPSTRLADATERLNSRRSVRTTVGTTGLTPISVGEEGVEAVDAAEEELAAPAPQNGAAVELVALQAVADVEVAERPVARVEADSPRWC